MSNQISIVMYHYVRKRDTGLFNGLKVRDTEEFISQIKYLNSNYKIIDTDALLEAITFHKPLPDKACLLTFDDGYLDHYINVFPLLKKLHLKGCFYPTVIGTTRKILLEVNKIHVLMSEIGYSEPYKLINLIKEEYEKLQQKQLIDINVSFDSCFKKYAVAKGLYSKEEAFIKAMLQFALESKIRTQIINSIFEKVYTKGEESLAELFYASEDMLSVMVDCGMHIGVHSANHVWLNTLTKKEQEKEIQDSLDMLKRVYNNKLENWSIAYPFGGYDKNTIDICTKLGCKFGLTTNAKVATLDNESSLLLSRLDTNTFPK